ncbi:MAG: response regulator transcription factor [Bacteroidetes bacterium]|nr:response regulator transcription factor [Bacteroidota bacterium]
MLKAIIIDDEPDARKTLSNFLKKYCENVVIVAEADGVKSGLEILQAHDPDVLFLDIRMADGSGFDLLKKVQQAADLTLSFEIIFTTAYDEFAIKAFKYSALDYLLKPIDPDELIQAVSKVKPAKMKGQTGLPAEASAQAGKKLEIATEVYSNQRFEKIALPNLEGLSLVNVNDIVRCEADGNYTNFHFLSGDKIVVPRTLKEYEELLPSSIFFRIHQSHLINLNYLKKYMKEYGGYVVMEDNAELEVARRKKDAFLQRIKK